MKLQTPVDVPTIPVRISYQDKIMLLGSCFVDNIGSKMKDYGFNVLANPFGTLYNPVSVCNAMHRLETGIPFSHDECRMMGSGAGLVCSFSHHTLAARKSEEEFLKDANLSLESASAFFREADTIIVTLGTAWVYRFVETGEIVSNCLKRDAKEFERERLSLKNIQLLLYSVVSRYTAADCPVKPKKFIFTVSPIRHLKDSAHGNQLSKSLLLLAVDSVIGRYKEDCAYFPAYEIMLDELRDYRFYAEDMIHPSAQAVEYIWGRFCDAALPQSEWQTLESCRKSFLQSCHRPLNR